MSATVEIVEKAWQWLRPHLWKIVPKRAPASVGSLAVAVIAISTYFGAQNLLPVVQVRDVVQLIVFVAIAEWVFFVALYLRVRERGSRTPISLPILGIEMTDPDGAKKKIDVDLLEPNARREGAADLVVHLKSASVVDGLRRLHGTLPPTPGFALCVGINPMGLALASFLAKEFRVPRENVGIVLTSDRPAMGSRKVIWALPKKETYATHWQANDAFIGNILLVDSEFKSGTMAKEAIEYLIRIHQCKPGQVWYVALVACGVTRQIVDECASRKLSDLLHDRKALTAHPNETEIVPNRVAFFSPGHVEMPFAIP